MKPKNTQQLEITKKPDPIMPSPIRHEMTIRFSKPMYQLLVGAAGGLKLPEFVRVLLASGLLRNKPVAVRVGVALVANLTLSMSGRMMEALHNLRDSIAKNVAPAVGVGNTVLAKLLEEPTTPPRLPSPQSERKQSNVERVHLTLDEWMFRALSVHARESGATGQPVVVAATRHQDITGRSGGAKAVKTILADVLDDYANHEPVVDAYVEAVSRLRTALNQMVQNEQATILRTLVELGRM
jgi:hypothetical protein